MALSLVGSVGYSLFLYLDTKETIWLLSTIALALLLLYFVSNWIKYVGEKFKSKAGSEKSTARANGSLLGSEGDKLDRHLGGQGQADPRPRFDNSGHRSLYNSNSIRISSKPNSPKGNTRKDPPFMQDGFEGKKKKP